MLENSVEVTQIFTSDKIQTKEMTRSILSNIVIIHPKMLPTLVG